MGQKQSHRGKHPEDGRLFAAKWLPVLQKAVVDLSYLLSRHYAEKAALKVVGDHYQLDVRQRLAVSRAACSDNSLDYRKTHEIPVEALTGRAVSIDGYNLLIAVESVLSSGVLLRGRDGCIRDMASVHGSYHKVEETLPAIRLIGEVLHKLGVTKAKWRFDAPVSNSGKLKTLLGREAKKLGWNWSIDLDNNPDNVLAASHDVVITSDSWIIDRAGTWANLTQFIVETFGLESSVLDIGRPPRL